MWPFAENDGAENVENRLYKRCSRQGSTYPESSNLIYKEKVAGSNSASPTLEKLRFSCKTQKMEMGAGEAASDCAPHRKR
jgi:hypothetical protein